MPSEAIGSIDRRMINIAATAAPPYAENLIFLDLAFQPFSFFSEGFSSVMARAYPCSPEHRLEQSYNSIPNKGSRLHVQPKTTKLAADREEDFPIWEAL